MFMKLESFQEIITLHNLLKPNKINPYENMSLELIAQQSNLLRDIAEQIKLKKTKSEKTVTTQMSNEDRFSARCYTQRSAISNYDTNMWKVDQNQLYDALRQVRQNCGQFTYQILQKVCSFRTQQRPHLKKIVQRQLKTNKHLKQRCLILNQQKQILKNQLDKLKYQINIFQQQKKKLKKQSQYLLEKQQNLINLQKTLINYQKIQIQLDKKNQIQYKLIQKQKLQIQQLRSFVDSLFLQNNNYIDKQQLLNNCKGLLKKQREFLLQQEHQIQRICLFFNQILQQFKNTSLQ